MNEYTEQDYLDACRALWRCDATEVCRDGKWESWHAGVPAPQRAPQLQWRPIDPLREYKEAFAQGKQVEFRWNNTNDWYPISQDCKWPKEGKYRIVKPKKVKLLPFAIKGKNSIDVFWTGTYFYETLEDAVAHFEERYIVAPIKEDGSIEVEV
jgi:hypothetical protein